MCLPTSRRKEGNLYSTAVSDYLGGFKIWENLRNIKGKKCRDGRLF
jgi:hypothetical protein